VLTGSQDPVNLTDMEQLLAYVAAGITDRDIPWIRAKADRPVRMNALPSSFLTSVIA
jgi:hypothetical protein